jgi:hypothetical protein
MTFREKREKARYFPCFVCLFSAKVTSSGSVQAPFSSRAQVLTDAQLEISDVINAEMEDPLDFSSWTAYRMTLMQPIEDQIQRLVNQPTERLNVELKSWIDPSSRKGQFMIGKACLALRNQNGGFLLIGFDDNGSPLPLENGLDVRAAFHIDNIQKIVSQFASKPFSVEVHFRQRDGVDYPVVQVESGVKTPVACELT